MRAGREKIIKRQEREHSTRGAQLTEAYTVFFREADSKRLMMCASRQRRTVTDMGAKPGV